MYTGYDPTAHRVELVDDPIFASTGEGEVAVAPALQRALEFPEFVLKVQVHSAQVQVQVQNVSLVTLQSRDRILTIAVY